MLASKYGYAHLSTGDLLRSSAMFPYSRKLPNSRAEVMSGTERWVRLYETLTSGQLAPDVSDASYCHVVTIYGYKIKLSSG